ncbi:hypothetical protein KBX37_00170 [Micromonospora sp. U56]|uniref:hypothetical protein n=1 Tax=Micromonospora sp. U56 TaxID=2824900 RepID=UPI001B391DFE|nr:hypothetical protein [Micromonospora sp. U56]MBQ0891533.1 hypothetical protein [Micromonospora sp. U56]
MRETALDEMFAEFEADALTIFRPPGVAAAQRRVRARRRRRRGLLAGLVALLVGAPTGALAVAGRDDRPPTPPTPTPGRLTERKVVVPGAAGALVDLRFVDARHGWALFDTCTREAPTDCRRTLGRTTDGGATWQGAALPVGDGGAQLMPVDERTLAVATGGRFLVTTDGGKTFTSRPGGPPYRDAWSVAETRSGFRLACPAEQEARGEDCDRFHLARLGRVPARTQPPLALDTNTRVDLVEGGDGRLWLASLRDGQATVVVSADGAATWRKLPPLTASATLTVSPDGGDAWLVDDRRGAVWRLVGDQWQPRPGMPHAPVDGGFAAAGDGAIFANSHGRVGFWVDGGYVDQPALRDALAHSGSSVVQVGRLTDGTLVLQGDGVWRIVGVGSGVDRTWTWFS